MGRFSSWIAFHWPSNRKFLWLLNAIHQYTKYKWRFTGQQLNDNPAGHAWSAGEPNGEPNGDPNDNPKDWSPFTALTPHFMQEHFNLSAKHAGHTICKVYSANDFSVNGSRRSQSTGWPTKPVIGEIKS